MTLEPDHSIIDRPHRYNVVGFNFQAPSGKESYVDLTLKLDEDVRRLRFYGPREIQIEPGFPDCPGLEIRDISASQLSGLNVRVSDFEASWGAMKFWSRDVIDLDN